MVGLVEPGSAGPPRAAPPRRSRCAGPGSSRRRNRAWSPPGSGSAWPRPSAARWSRTRSGPGRAGWRQKPGRRSLVPCPLPSSAAASPAAAHPGGSRLRAGRRCWSRRRHRRPAPPVERDARLSGLQQGDIPFAGQAPALLPGRVVEPRLARDIDQDGQGAVGLEAREYGADQSDQFFRGQCQHGHPPPTIIPILSRAEKDRVEFVARKSCKNN